MQFSARIADHLRKGSAKGRTSVFAGRRGTKHKFRSLRNRRKSSKNRSDDASRTSRAKKTRFFRSRTRLGVDFGRLGALPDAPGCPCWCPGAPLGTLRAPLPPRFLSFWAAAFWSNCAWPEYSGGAFYGVNAMIMIYMGGSAQGPK